MLCLMAIYKLALRHCISSGIVRTYMYVYQAWLALSYVYVPYSCLEGLMNELVDLILGLNLQKFVSPKLMCYYFLFLR